MRRFVIIGLLISFSLAHLNCLAQINDAGLWTSYTLKKKFNKKWTANITEQIRWDQNLSRLSYYNTEIGFDYKIKKHFTVSPNYRFVHNRRQDMTFGIKHRFFIDFSVQGKRHKFTGTFRTRLQSQYSDTYIRDFGFIPQNYNRNMFTIKYKLNKSLNPYISHEIFTALNGPYIYKVTSTMSYFGVIIDINKNAHINLYYIVQLIRNSPIPKNNYISGISISYSI